MDRKDRDERASGLAITNVVIAGLTLLVALIALLAEFGWLS
jgi:hypothetical protein